MSDTLIIIFLASGILLSALLTRKLFQKALSKSNASDISISLLWMILLLCIGGWITIIVFFIDQTKN